MPSRPVKPVFLAIWPGIERRGLRQEKRFTSECSPLCSFFQINEQIILIKFAIVRYRTIQLLATSLGNTVNFVLVTE